MPIKAIRTSSTVCLVAGLLSACDPVEPTRRLPDGGSVGGGVASATGGGNSNPGSGGGNSNPGSGGGNSNPGSGGGTPVATVGNPFAGAEMFVNPDYAAQIDTSIAKSPGDAALLQKVKQFPTAVWIDTIANISRVKPALSKALEQQNAKGKPVVTVFVVYNLPNRDCHANASNGELKLPEGLATYKTKYIDELAKRFTEASSQRIVAIIEPDSLPNLATNLSDPRCVAADSAYREGVTYAISQLALPNVSLYLDAAHAGWLGWADNQTKTAAIFKEVAMKAGGLNKIRGFATNVANYTTLTTMPERFSYDGNPCKDELTYVQQMGNTLKAAGFTDAHFIVDTSRNGKSNIRSKWGNWCNNAGAGLGERPKADPTSGVDAYFWVKPPGESDGTSDRAASRYDSFCGEADAVQPAPEAGTWFHNYFLMVAKNATPAL